jgi:hypothetical protein
MYVEPDCTEDEKTQLLADLQTMRYKFSMVVPRDMDNSKPTKELKFLEVEKNGADFAVFFDKMDKEIFTCLGIPESIFSAAGGSYSLGMVQLKMFIKSVLACQDQLDDIWNNHILAPIIFANFGTTVKGKMFFQTTEGAEWKEELEAGLAWLNSAYAKEGDESYVRSRAGLPPVHTEGKIEQQEGQGEEDEVKEEKNDNRPNKKSK